MSITEAIALLKANGYSVSKSRKKQTCCTYHDHGGSLEKSCGGDMPRNAVGKPFSPQYDPNWKRKTPLTSIRRLSAPYGNSMRWVQS